MNRRQPQDNSEREFVRALEHKIDDVMTTTMMDAIEHLRRKHGITDLAAGELVGRLEMGDLQEAWEEYAE